jgi:dienelactone hydrolase
MKWSVLALLAAFAGAAQAKVVTKAVEYTEGGATLEGYLAYDDAKAGTKPGVLVVHEWKGLDAYAKKRTEQLAELGYVAFAADIYGKGVRPTDPKEAGATAGKFKGDRALLRRRVQAGLDTLRKQQGVDTKRLAAIGYCFGGTTVLELARSGADVAGVVSFHGGLDTPEPAKSIKAKVLALHGADDPHVPEKDVLAFEKEMRDAKADWQLVSYGGAVHGFTNPDNGNDPSKGVAYDAAADRRSWQAMRDFFAEILK